MKFYELLRFENEGHVISKRQTENDFFVYMIPVEDFYDKLLEAHVQTGHGRKRQNVVLYETESENLQNGMGNIYVVLPDMCS